MLSLPKINLSASFRAPASLLRRSLGAGQAFLASHAGPETLEALALIAWPKTKAAGCLAPPKLALPQLNTQAVAASGRQASGPSLQPTTFNGLKPRQLSSLGCRDFEVLGASELIEAWLQDPMTQAPKDVLQRLVRGTQVLRDLQRPKRPLTAADLVDVVWALACRAAAQGTPFYQGTFSLWDGPNPACTGSIRALGLAVGQVPEVYSRASSHLHAFANNVSLGLDVDVAKFGCLLPGGRGHLLIHLVEDEQGVAAVFFKAEHFGTQNVYDLLQHAKGYLWAQWRRINNARDVAGTRRERVPTEVVHNFERASAGHAKQAGMLASVRTEGVRASVSYLEKLLLEARGPGRSSQVNYALVRKERDRLRDVYAHVERRLGREHIELLPLQPLS